MFKPICFAALCGVLLVGCASFKQGDPAEEAELKKFSPVANKTSLYVCREDGFVAGGVSNTIFVDDNIIGTTKPNTFVHTVVEPGKHTVRMKNDGISGGYDPSISIDTKPDEVAFLWIGVTGHGFGTLTIDNFENKQQATDCVSKAIYSVKAE